MSDESAWNLVIGPGVVIGVIYVLVKTETFGAVMTLGGLALMVFMGVQVWRAGSGQPAGSYSGRSSGGYRDGGADSHRDVYDDSDCDGDGD